MTEDRIRLSFRMSDTSKSHMNNTAKRGRTIAICAQVMATAAVFLVFVSTVCSALVGPPVPTGVNALLHYQRMAILVPTRWSSTVAALAIAAGFSWWSHKSPPAGLLPAWMVVAGVLLIAAGLAGIAFGFTLIHEGPKGRIGLLAFGCFGLLLISRGVCCVRARKRSTIPA